MKNTPDIKQIREKVFVTVKGFTSFNKLKYLKIKANSLIRK